MKLPVQCPSCESELMVSKLSCKQCTTSIQGEFSLPALTLLTKEEQAFVLDFVLSSGSLKLMAERLKLSYPTVRNMLDAIIEQLKSSTHGS